MRRFTLLFLLLMPLSVLAANPTDEPTTRSSNCETSADTSVSASSSTNTQRIDSGVVPSVKSNTDAPINRVRRSNWHSFLPGMFR